MEEGEVYRYLEGGEVEEGEVYRYLEAGEVEEGEVYRILRLVKCKQERKQVNTQEGRAVLKARSMEQGQGCGSVRV